MTSSPSTGSAPHRRGASPPLVRALALGVVAALALVLALAQAARADFGFVPGSAAAGTYQADASGTITGPERQAGATPFVATTSFELHSHATAGGGVLPDGNVKDVVVDLPAGMVGNPEATPRCPRAAIMQGASNWIPCPPSTQVGTITLTFGYTRASDAMTAVQQYPVFNVEPRKGDVADFTFIVFGFGGTRIIASIRGDDHGIRTTISNISTVVAMIRTDLTLWGVPADPLHDPDRGKVCLGPLCLAPGGQSSAAAPKSFLRNPTVCDGTEPVTRFRVDSWQHPGAWQATTATSPSVQGCDRVPFDTSVEVHPTTRRASAPSGLDVGINVRQSDDPGVPASAHVKDVVMRLPAGMTVNPSAADGLVGCSPVQIGLGTDAEPTCPDASKLGSVQIDTPVLPVPLTGSIYLARQNDNPFHSLLALYLVAEGNGVLLKLPGKVVPDARTGQLTATFADNPQLPFSRLELSFDGGARAPLVTPRGCGTFQTQARLTAWTGRVVESSPSMTIDQGCDQAGRFAPSLSAGTTNPVAGASSPLVLRFARPEGQQELGAVNGSLPPGLLGVLASVPLCSAAQGAAGTCPAASRVGYAQVASGAGPSPVWLPVAGRPQNAVYLTEPYRAGDVAGMSIVVPAVAGPFDLGTVVTKVYLKLRDEDQGIDMQSDRLPRIMQGIPLGIQQVAVTIDRKGFMVNPTSCRAMATYANVFSQSWVKAPITSRFQVGGCSDLTFSPIITAQAGGKGNVKRYRHPALTVSIRQPAGQAHLDRTNVVLPKELNIDLKAPALKASCPRDVYAQDKCSPVATVGTVKAVTPLLREPLTGPAFLIQKKGQLPDIVMRLRNNRMSLDLIGVLDFLKDGRLITRVKGIPDAALSSFVLNIKGGKNGSLLNRSDLCAHKRLTKATFKGQNGKLSRKSPVTRIAGCKSKASVSRSASRRAARAASARASAARGVHAGSFHSRAAGGRS